MASVSSSSWMPPAGKYSAKVGKSLTRVIKARKGEPQQKSKFPEPDFYSFRYNFIPPSVDSTRPGTIEVRKGQDVTNVTVERANTQTGGEGGHVFQGTETTAKEWDCILIYDEELGSFTLEKLDSYIGLTHDKKTSKAPRHPGSSLPPSRPSTSTSTSSSNTPLAQSYTKKQPQTAAERLEAELERSLLGEDEDAIGEPDDELAELLAPDPPRKRSPASKESGHAKKDTALSFKKVKSRAPAPSKQKHSARKEEEEESEGEIKEPPMTAAPVPAPAPAPAPPAAPVKQKPKPSKSIASAAAAFRANAKPSPQHTLSAPATQPSTPVVPAPAILSAPAPPKHPLPPKPAVVPAVAAVTVPPPRPVAAPKLSASKKRELPSDTPSQPSSAKKTKPSPPPVVRAAPVRQPAPKKEVPKKERKEAFSLALPGGEGVSLPSAPSFTSPLELPGPSQPEPVVLGDDSENEDWDEVVDAAASTSAWKAPEAPSRMITMEEIIPEPTARVEVSDTLTLEEEDDDDEDDYEAVEIDENEFERELEAHLEDDEEEPEQFAGPETNSNAITSQFGDDDSDEYSSSEESD